MFSRGEIPLLLKKAGITNLSSESIPQDGFIFGDCICFSVGVNRHPSNAQQQKYQPWEELSKSFEARRETTQFVYDSLCTFTRAFNIKFDKFFANKETEDVPLQVLEFDGKHIFTLAMRTKNKPLMTEAIAFWRDMMVWLEETLVTSNIQIRSSIYSGNICVGFFPDLQRNEVNLFYYGSAFNGAKRGLKLSFELHLEQSIVLDSEFALSFPRKTNLLAYALKQIDISNIKIGDSKIISSFSVLRHDSIEKSGNSSFFLKQFEFNASTFSDSPLREGMSLEQHLKTLDFNKEGFEVAGKIKITFSIPLLLPQNRIQGSTESMGYSGSQIAQTLEMNKKPSKDHPRGKDTDWSASRINLKDVLRRIILKLNPLITTLGAELDEVNYCGFNGLLDLNVMIRGALDMSVRTALFAGSISSLSFVDKLSEIKASSTLFFFFVLMGTGNRVYSFKEQDLEYVRQEGGGQELRLSIDAANHYLRAFPVNSNNLQPEWTPIQCSPARIFTDKRKSVIAQLTQAFRTGVPSTFTIIEGEKGTGKTCFLQLLQNDISAYFQNQCVVLTKSLRSSFFKEIFQNCKEESTNRKLFNGFRSILRTESKDFYSRIGCQNKELRSLSMNVPNFQGVDTFELPDQQDTDFEFNQRPTSYQETINQPQDNLVDIALILLKQHLLKAGRRLIVLVFDEIEYLDYESWEIVKYLCAKGIGQGITVAIIGSFRYYLPGELHADMQNQQNQTHSLRIKTSEQLFKNNELLRDRIMACESDRAARINLNSLSDSDAELLLFTFAVNAFNARINKFESTTTFKTLMLLAKQHQANTPLKLAYFFHQMCKQEYVLGYYEEIVTKSNPQQKQYKQSEPKEQQQKANQQKQSETAPTQAEKTYDQDYDINDSIIDSEVIPKNTFPMILNSSSKPNTMAEESVILCLSSSFESKESSDFQSCLDVPIAIMNHSQVMLYFLLHEDDARYYSIPNEKYPVFESSTILMPNWSILLTKAMSLNGSSPSISKLNYALSRSLSILPEQVNDTLIDLSLFRFIRIVNSKGDLLKNKAKRSLLGSNETNSQNKEEFQINWNESLFFQMRQSLQQSASRRMRLLLHRCFYESMESLLVKLGKKAEKSYEYASIFMEMLHHNSKFSLLKSSLLLKTISPQIAFLFRKGVFYQGIARKISSKTDSFAECDVRLSHQNVCIYKRSQAMRENSLTIEHKNLWIIKRDGFSFEEDLGNSSIDLTCTQITKKPKTGKAKIVKKLRLIKLSFRSKIEYYTFFLGLKYLQIPQAMQKLNHLRIKISLSSQLPNFIDPMGKTEMLKNKQSESLYFLKSDTELIRKKPEVQEQIDNILYFIPQGILDLMKNYKQKKSSAKKRNINPGVTNTKGSEEVESQINDDDLKNTDINRKSQQQDKNMENAQQGTTTTFMTPEKNKNLLNSISTAKSEFEETEEKPRNNLIEQRKHETGFQGETQPDTGKFNEIDQKSFRDPNILQQKQNLPNYDVTQTFRVQQENSDDRSNPAPPSNQRQFQKGDPLLSIEEEDQTAQNSYFNQSIPQELFLDDTPPLLAQREDINSTKSNKQTNLVESSSREIFQTTENDVILASSTKRREAKVVEIKPPRSSTAQNEILFTFSNDDNKSPPQAPSSHQSSPRASITACSKNNSVDSHISRQHSQQQNTKNVLNSKVKQTVLPNQIVSKQLQMRLAHLQFEQNNITPSQSVSELAQNCSQENHPNLPVYQEHFQNYPQSSSTSSLSSSSFNYSQLNRLGSYNQTTSSSVAHLSKVKISPQEAQKKQQELFQKKKENLKKMANLSSSPSASGVSISAISPVVSEHIFPQLEDQRYQQNQYDRIPRKNSQEIIDSRLYSFKQSVSNDSIIRGIAMEDCWSMAGDVFEVKRNDCMIVEFLEDGRTLCYYNNKVGIIPRQFIKIIQQSLK